MPINTEQLFSQPGFWQAGATALTFLVASGSLALSLINHVRTKKSELIKNLLGEKETVAYAALKTLRDGLPARARERQLLLDALLQASLFENSSRARAFLFRVIEEHGKNHCVELRASLKRIETTFANMKSYKFKKGELDLSTGERLLGALRKVIARQCGPCETSNSETIPPPSS